MSGGSKNYIYRAIERELCGQMYDDLLNDLLKDIVRLAHDLEWYESSDISKEQYLKRVSDFKKKWFWSSKGDEQIKGYIDAKLKELKQFLYDVCV